MSELIARRIGQLMSETGRCDTEVYLKSEADKVIAHNKYKRCLDKAKWCFTKSNYHFVLARHGEYVKDNNRKSLLYSKWHNRWLEFAEKFKSINHPVG